MPRRKRIIIPGMPHHITQRGGRNQNVFFNQEDRLLYLKLLETYCRYYLVKIISYCLMTNHVHHLLVPESKIGLSRALQMTHKRYADHINQRMGWQGHLWQERFYSCPVDEEYYWITIKYIERNPVEARMVQDAVQYKWSSAAAHAGLKTDPLLSDYSAWYSDSRAPDNWASWLQGECDHKKLSSLRWSTLRDLPCGSEDYLDRLEKETGQAVRPAKMGRPIKS